MAIDAAADDTADRAEQVRHNARDRVPVAPGTIVVGFDGSLDSMHALRTALTLAAALKAPVTIVRAWNIDSGLNEFRDDAGYVSSFDEITATVRLRLEQTIQREVNDFAEVETECRAVLDQPGEILTRLASDALMLVVATRGRGAIAGMLLGSVSSYCVHHAQCPVLVVPAATH